MLARNDTSFAAIGFEQAHRDGSDMGVLAVRGSYDLKPDGSLVLLKEQSVVLVDEYEGDPHRTPLVRVSDLVPFRPGADITLLANSYPDSGEPAGSWIARLEVGSHASEIRVHGPRTWTETDGGLTAGEPEDAVGVMVDWRFAWSDLNRDDTTGGPSVSENPIGVRLPVRDRHRTSSTPQQGEMALIDSPDENYDEPYVRRKPHGFGPVPPFWRSRQRYAGTYDDEWTRNRHPRLPSNFDYRFYNCAPSAMALPYYLRGDERVELRRLLPGRDRFDFQLPGVQPVARYEWRDGREVSLRCNLDGVHMDFRAPPMRVDLTWRAWLPICPSFFAIHLSELSVGDPELGGLPRSGLHGIEGIDEFGQATS